MTNLTTILDRTVALRKALCALPRYEKCQLAVRGRMRARGRDGQLDPVQFEKYELCAKELLKVQKYIADIFALKEQNETRG